MELGAGTGSAFWSTLEKRIHAEWLAITLLMLLATIVLGLFSEHAGTARLDQTLYDSVLRAAPARDTGDDIAIIVIDDSSIDELGHWPWRRSTHARLLDQLSEARRVGFDIVFSEANTVFPEDDASLAQAIARHGRVVLPTILVNDSSTGLYEQTPLPALVEAAAGLGYINVYPDSDGTVRSLTLQKQVSSGAVLQHFTLAMLEVDAPDEAPPDRTKLIPYAGPAGHFSFYPYAAVLRGDIPAEHFRDRLVLVGVWSSGLGDTFPTPMTERGDAMAGVEILANGLHALREDNWVRTPPTVMSALLNAVPVLLVCLLLRRFSPRQSFLATLAIMSGWTALAAMLLLTMNVWLPVTSGLIGVAFSFPLWSWRSQEASLQHIDQELRALEQATAWDASYLAGKNAAIPDRSLPTRVRILHQAIARFRHAQQKREETLRFLSHDMRAPQNAILAMIDMQRREPDARDEREVLTRIEQRATDTLELMDGFVQLERAEVIPLGQQAIDLSDLLQEACDVCWELASQRQIRLETDALPEHAWVQGDRKLLGRVLRNLIDNAIKYSPDNTRIQCTISRAGANWNISIEDQGRGIPPAQLQGIFEPFTRVATDTPGNAGGAGLGLAFVRTTLLRHGGTISAHSQEGRGSTFVVSLPAMSED